MYRLSKNPMELSKLLKALNLTGLKTTDNDGNTALHLTKKNETFTREEAIEILETLLDKGVDSNVKNCYDETALQIAVNRRLKDVIDFLIAREVNKDSIAYFFIKDEYSKFRYLTTQGYANEFAYEIHGIENEPANFVEWLIERKFDFYCKTEESTSAFHLVIEYNLQHILPVLLKHCEDINLVDKENRISLHLFLLRYYYACRDEPVHIISNDWYTTRYAIDIVNVLQYGDGKSELYPQGYRHMAGNTRLRRRLFLLSIEFSQQEGWHFARKTRFVDCPPEDSSCEDPNIVIYPQDDYHFDKIRYFVEHSMKLKAANLPWDPEIDNAFIDGEPTKDFYKYHYKACLIEVETLKNTFIDDRTSLYTLLHMNLNRRRAFIHNEELQKLVRSATLWKRFPEYYCMILACYREAVARRSLLKQAREAWLELTEIALPDICTELIFSFLSNSDLFDMIKKY